MTSEPDYSPILKHFDLLPFAPYVLGAAWEESRSGVDGRWLIPCGDDPPMIAVAVRTGHVVAPLIRDSRRFCLTLLGPDLRHIARRFEQVSDPEDDPFMGLATRHTAGGSPYLENALAYFDCELSRHFDLDSDHELYVGIVQEARDLRVKALR